MRLKDNTLGRWFMGSGFASGSFSFSILQKIFQNEAWQKMKAPRERF
jgi:hypothetical protein